MHERTLDVVLSKVYWVKKMEMERMKDKQERWEQLFC